MLGSSDRTVRESRRRSEPCSTFSGRRAAPPRSSGWTAAATACGFDKRVGYLPGDLHLFDRMTGSQHLDWFGRARGGYDPSVTASIVDRFEIAMDRPVDQLSKGNRQKIGLLLAFMCEPELLVLDEPTSGLDPLMQAEFERLLRETAAAGTDRACCRRIRWPRCNASRIASR